MYIVPLNTNKNFCPEIVKRSIESYYHRLLTSMFTSIHIHEYFPIGLFIYNIIKVHLF